MPLLISQVNFPSNVTAGRDDVTRLRITRGELSKGGLAPLLSLFAGDGSFWRYLVELTVADRSSGTILQGGAQLIIASKRIAGLIIKGELTKLASQQKIKLDMDSGRMACFSINCDELGLVGAPTSWRGKPRLIQLGTDIERDDGFAIKITMAVGFLSSTGEGGPITMERIVARLEEIGLTVSLGASLY